MKFLDWCIRFDEMAVRIKNSKPGEELQVLEDIAKIEKHWNDGGLAIHQEEVENEFARVNINLALATLELVKIKTTQKLEASKQAKELLSKFTLSKA